MTAIVDWLDFALQPHWDDEERSEYNVSKIKDRFAIEELTENSGIVLCQDDYRLLFAVMHYGSIGDDHTGISGECLFHGEGVYRCLRECRHTYWGEPDNNGYISYPDGRVITAAFKRLSEYFDDMI